jgi:hypothetical protein
MSFRRHLRAALYKLRWCGHNERSKATRRACEEYFRKRVRRGRRIAEERERAVISHEQERVQCAVAKDRCCGAYAEYRD